MFYDFVYAPSESATRTTPLHIFRLEFVVSLSLLDCSYFDYVGAHPLVRDALAEMSEANTSSCLPQSLVNTLGTIPPSVHGKHSLEKLIFRIENCFTSFTFLFNFVFLF